MLILWSRIDMALSRSLTSIGLNLCAWSVKILLILFVWERSLVLMEVVGLAVVEVLAATQEVLEKQLKQELSLSVRPASSMGRHLHYSPGGMS